MQSPPITLLCFTDNGTAGGPVMGQKTNDNFLNFGSCFILTLCESEHVTPGHLKRITILWSSKNPDFGLTDKNIH